MASDDDNAVAMVSERNAALRRESVAYQPLIDTMAIAIERVRDYTLTPHVTPVFEGGVQLSLAAQGSMLEYEDMKSAVRGLGAWLAGKLQSQIEHDQATLARLHEELRRLTPEG